MSAVHKKQSLDIITNQYLQAGVPRPDERHLDYMTTGSVLGEYPLLSGQRTESFIVCETSVQLYNLPYDAIQAALELFTDRPSLETRLWRVCASRIAAIVLRPLPHFVGWTIERLRLHLETAILHIKRVELPEGGAKVANPVFDIDGEHLSDIILIHGYAHDQKNGIEFIGPCYIPQKTEKLILIVSSVNSWSLFLSSIDGWFSFFLLL